MFRNRLLVPSWRAKLGPIDFAETSVNNYEPTPRKIQKSDELDYPAVETWNLAIGGRIVDKAVLASDFH